MGRPVLYKTPEELEAKIAEYFKLCDDSRQVITDIKGRTVIFQKPYSVSGLCLHLNMTRETLSQYAKQKGFSDSISRAKQLVENYVEEGSLTGQLDVRAAMFNLTNNFGWADRREIDQRTVSVTLELTDDERKQRIEQLQDKLYSGKAKEPVQLAKWKKLQT